MKRLYLAVGGLALVIVIAFIFLPAPPKTAYFNENASVMYFYSPTCHWCIEQTPILEELANEGYTVKPMDVKRNRGYWDEYDIDGTPMFIAPDGERLVGYQKKGILKAFLDSY